MRKKQLGFLIFAAVVIVSAFFWYSNNQKNVTEISQLKQEVKQQESKESKLTLEKEKLSDDYKKLYKEKNGAAKETLLQVTNDLFSIVYNYDTTNSNDSVKERKQAASKLTEQEALDALFPKDADKVVPSVTAISKLEQTPAVYLMSSDDTNQSAIVEVHYSVSIAGSEEQKGRIFYKISYNQATNKFTKIQNLGQINL